MRTMLTVTLPFFALILLGYIAAKRRWVPGEAVPAFNGFLLYFAVPAMLFRFASNTPFHDIANGPYFVAYTVAGLCTLAFVVLVAWRMLGALLRDAAFYGLAASVTNIGYLGIPMIVALMGERAAAPTILAAIVDQTIVVSAALAVAQTDVTGARGWTAGIRDALARAALNPFLLSIFAGALFSAFAWTLPTPVDEIVRLLANAAGPCALFAIGVSLARPDDRPKSSIVALPVAAKLLLHPILVWALMRPFVDPFAATAAVLAASLPTAGWVFIFAQRYDADSGRISATILLTTALAFVTFSAWVWVLGI
jgi:malonate transporter